MKTTIQKIGILAVTLCIMSSFNVLQAQKKQDEDVNYSELENKQDEIESLTLKIFDYYDDYPDFTYSYDYDDNGDLESVEIEGVNNLDDKKDLEKYLSDLAYLRDDIENMANRVNIYYVTETVPKPADGYEKFYDKLYANIDYPDVAVNNGIEGNVYVRFIVDDEGEILNTNAVHNIDSNNDYAVSEMVKEAKRAVKATSGEWIPGKVGDIAVANWMMVPVEFNIKQNPSIIRPVF